jgi:SAM-dependent methyltransferase
VTSVEPKPADGHGAPIEHHAAPDGSPVEVYLRVPCEPDFTPVLQALPPSCRVLDLGCGVGRLANVLAARGFVVTGVDEDPEMLAKVDPRVTVVPARIAQLDLDESFDAIVLASHLVNVADTAQRHALVAAASRHVSTDGQVFIQHHDPTSDAYHPAAEPVVRRIESDRGPLEMVFRVLFRVGERFTGEVVYRIDDGQRVWRQIFNAELLHEGRLEKLLAARGLEVTARLDGRWVVAAPYPTGTDA